MTFINEYTTFCAICGGPIEVEGINSEWLSRVILLNAENDRTDSALREIPAKNQGGPFFELSGDGAKVTACDVHALARRRPALYIPCHSSCIFIAKKAINVRRAASQQTVDELMKHLWRVLKAYYTKAGQSKIQPLCNIYSAQAYGAIWRFQELVWEPGTDPALRFESLHFEADPLHIPNLTKSVLSHLDLLPATQNGPLPTSRQAGLPSINNLKLECTFETYPTIWREAFARTYLPWLWDLDQGIIAHKEASKPADHEWNWELLVRQLAQVDIHEPRAVLDDLPMGLRSRRRIWRLIEDYLCEKFEENDDGSESDVSDGSQGSDDDEPRDKTKLKGL